MLVQLVDTTVEIANKVGAAEIASRVVEDLKDENEQFRKMVMDCIEKASLCTCMYMHVDLHVIHVHALPCSCIHLHAW